ncbi:MAG: hypothetical protein Q7S50_02525 [bacterium]|nr:hypothetical protein [bacterium]
MNEFSRPIAVLFIAFLIWQILAAFKGGWGTWGQIQAGGHKAGMGIIYHGSIWGGLYLWWVMATIWQRFGDQWSTPASIAIPVVVGIVITILMLIVWKQGNQLEAHQQTSAGIPLALQLGLAIAITCAFYVFTKDVSSDFSLLVTVLMFVYVFLSMHIVLSAFEPVFYTDKPAQNPVTWITLGGASMLLAVGYVGQQHKWWGWW